jgi:hypothetical protein
MREGIAGANGVPSPGPGANEIADRAVARHSVKGLN